MNCYHDFTIVLPTLNEKNNIGRIIKDLIGEYTGIKIIVSDDGSRDGTKDIVLSYNNENIYFLDRAKKDNHGLTASVLEATKLVKTKYFIVMDADNQHPWEKVEEIVSFLRKEFQIVIACREKVVGDWSFFRKIISYLGNIGGKLSLSIRNKGNYREYDILSGFFGVETYFWKTIIFKDNKIEFFRLKGYKILFDFLKIAPSEIKICNIFYDFNLRMMGVSKSNVKIYVEYLKSLIF